MQKRDKYCLKIAFFHWLFPPIAVPSSYPFSPSPSSFSLTLSHFPLPISFLSIRFSLPRLCFAITHLSPHHVFMHPSALSRISILDLIRPSSFVVCYFRCRNPPSIPSMGRLRIRLAEPPPRRIRQHNHTRPTARWNA